MDVVLLQFDHHDPDQHGRVLVLAGLPDGSFEGNSTWVHGVPPGALGLFVRDMNGDGKNDIAVRYLPDQQQVFLRKEGSFVALPPFAVADRGCSMMADLDGDSFPDFLCALGPPGAITGYRPLFNKGDATFTPGVDVKTSAIDASPWRITLRGPSLDREYILNGTGNDRSHLLRIVNREAAPQVIELPAGGSQGLAVDVFGLGFPQIGFTDTSSGALSLFKMDPTTLASSAAAPLLTSSAAAGHGTSVNAADMNGDGLVDLIFTRQGVSILQQLADGTFLETFSIPFTEQPAGVLGRAEAHDMDGDGLPELVFPETLTVYPNTSR